MAGTLIAVVRLCALLLVLAAASAAAPQTAETFITGLTFAATDQRSSFSLPLGRDIVVRIRRAVDAHGRHFGWDFSAVDRRLKDSPNFFYECLCGHGPRPHDLYAWHFPQRYYPAERVLPVYGYPFEVRVRCIECRVEGESATALHFTAGTIEVGWRRLRASNDRQRRTP